MQSRSPLRAGDDLRIITPERVLRGGTMRKMVLVAALAGAAPAMAQTVPVEEVSIDRLDAMLADGSATSVGVTSGRPPGSAPAMVTPRRSPRRPSPTQSTHW